MRNILKAPISLKHFLIGAMVIGVVALFCYASGYSYILAFLVLLFSMHLFFIERASGRQYLHLGLLLTLGLFMAHAVIVYGGWPPRYIPVASLAMLTMLLFNDLQIMFIMSVLASVAVTLGAGGGLEMALIFFVGSVTAAYSVRDARSRGTMINAGFYVACMQVFAAVLLALGTTNIASREFLNNVVRPLAVNGFLAAFITLATLKIFESLFGVVTNFSLLELSDFNQPLLKKMILEAPGTYHHSLVVSNLAEAAAEAVGANGLLTRVGAYYHDIGKIEKPEYFTENQLLDANKHDNLEASVSRLVIISHVKQGLETAKKYKLNPVIADFIPQHHGTSLTYFFYQKALEAAEDPATVKPEDFRYPGPKPQSRETAIVMLADSVEAAIRSLEEPTPKRIEELVRKIINNKFIDGQLDECNLTLRDIDKIALTFTRALSAMYHTRVRYPERNGGTGAKADD